MRKMQKTPREVAVEILNRTEKKGVFAESLLDDFLLNHTGMNPLDRKLLTQIAYGTLRMRAYLDWVIRRFYRGNFTTMEPGIKNILRTAMYQIYFTDRIPDFAVIDEAVKTVKKTHPQASGLVNAILRNTLRGKDRVIFPDIQQDPVRHIATVYSHPAWLVKRWLPVFGKDETVAMCKKNNEIPPYTVRINRMKTTRRQSMEELIRDGFDVKATDFSPDGIIILHSAVPLRETKLFQSGCIQVQDEASQLIAYLAAPKPGDTVLDICAGSGIKTTHIAAIMKNRGHIVAVDINKVKIASLKENVKKQGISIVEAKVGDVTIPIDSSHESYDIVLIDAPCSGVGTLRRNPEIKWHSSDAAVRKLLVLQKAVLNNAAQYVKKGGRLVYSTCSILPEENEQMIRDFITRHRNFTCFTTHANIHTSLIDNRGFFRTYPHRHQMDGFFGAALLKDPDAGVKNTLCN